MSSVSSEMRWRLSAFMCSSVRMLCSRSASFTSSTRMSLEMATRSLRKFSACSAFLVTRSRRRILVSPSTRVPISGPNSWSISARVIGVSSMTSCSSAVTMVASSSFRSVRMAATSSGWEKYGIAGGTLLGAMGLHGVDVSAVEKGLVRLRIVAENSFDELVLPHHGPPRSLGGRRSESEARLLRPCWRSAPPMANAGAYAQRPRSRSRAHARGRLRWGRRSRTAPSGSCFRGRAEAAPRSSRRRPRRSSGRRGRERGHGDPAA